MKVSIVIPNYNGKHFLAPCLDSLAQQTFQDFDVCVVDNASSDGSVSFLQENYPEVKVLELDQNYGFSKAVNAGIKESDAPYVILLNNDTSAEPDFVSELVKAIESDPHLFSVSSKMIQEKDPDLIDSAGDLYTILGWAVCRGNGRSVKNYTKTDVIFSSCAGAAIYRRSVFTEIGFFDESHFAYLEDVDMGYRAKIYGYRNLFCPTAIVSHVGSGTSGSKYNSFKVKLSARNSVWLNVKNMPILQLILNLIPLIIGYFVKYLYFVRIGFAKDYRDGIKEGLKGLEKISKVNFHWSHLPSYVAIEGRLIQYTFLYVYDWVSRKLS